MTRTPPKVSIIISTYNHYQDLIKPCLESLAKTTPPIVEVITVDDGSTDETLENLEPLGHMLFGDAFRCIRFEKNQRNIARTLNTGAQAAHGEFLFLLNNDTIAQPNWLPPLLQAFDDDAKLAGVGPLLMYPNKTVQHLGIAFWSAYQIPIGHLYRYLPSSHKLVTHKRQFQALTGAAMLIPRELFLHEGLWDEEFCNGFEDIDFCLRLSQEGYKFSCIPESTLFHLETQSIIPHENENANNKRLKEKWDLSACIDLPDLVADDGYMLYVTPELQTKINITPEQSKEYISSLCPFNPERCFSFLEEEPFWLDGYDLLGSYLEHIGEWEIAYQLYLDVIRYTQTCSFTDYTRIIRTMKRLGKDITVLDPTLNEIQQVIQDEKSYEEKRQWLIKKFFDGTPAQRALLPQYDQAAKEAKKLRLALITHF